MSACFHLSFGMNNSLFPCREPSLSYLREFTFLSSGGDGGLDNLSVWMRA